jgi:hypothetical protein
MNAFTRHEFRLHFGNCLRIDRVHYFLNRSVDTNVV